jgi:hypothetical protein
LKTAACNRRLRKFHAGTLPIDREDYAKPLDPSEWDFTPWE